MSNAPLPVFIIGGLAIALMVEGQNDPEFRPTDVLQPQPTQTIQAPVMQTPAIAPSPQTYPPNSEAPAGYVEPTSPDQCPPDAPVNWIGEGENRMWFCDDPTPSPRSSSNVGIQNASRFSNGTHLVSANQTIEALHQFWGQQSPGLSRPSFQTAASIPVMDASGQMIGTTSGQYSRGEILVEGAIANTPEGVFVTAHEYGHHWQRETLPTAVYQAPTQSARDQLRAATERQADCLAGASIRQGLDSGVFPGSIQDYRQIAASYGGSADPAHGRANMRADLVERGLTMGIAGCMG